MILKSILHDAQKSNQRNVLLLLKAVDISPQTNTDLDAVQVAHPALLLRSETPFFLSIILINDYIIHRLQRHGAQSDAAVRLPLEPRRQLQRLGHGAARASHQNLKLLLRGARGGSRLKRGYPCEQRQALAAGVGVQAGGAVVEGLAHLADEAHEGRLGADIDDTGLWVGGVGSGGAAVGGLVAADGAFVDF